MSIKPNRTIERCIACNEPIWEGQPAVRFNGTPIHTHCAVPKQDNATMDVRDAIRKVCTETQEMLLEKNESYGNSALDPVRIFSQASPVEQLLVRIDDKLSRIKRGNDLGEDTISDLIGYLVLLKVARRKEAQ